MKAKIRAMILASAIAVGGIVAVAAPAEAYTWSQKWYNSQTGQYWAYKTCTRDEWFNGCNNGWYSSPWPWWLWG